MANAATPSDDADADTDVDDDYEGGGSGGGGDSVFVHGSVTHLAPGPTPRTQAGRPKIDPLARHSAAAAKARRRAVLFTAVPFARAARWLRRHVGGVDVVLLAVAGDDNVGVPGAGPGPGAGAGRCGGGGGDGEGPVARSVRAAAWLEAQLPPSVPRVHVALRAPVSAPGASEHSEPSEPQALSALRARLCAQQLPPLVVAHAGLAGGGGPRKLKPPGGGPGASGDDVAPSLDTLLDVLTGVAEDPDSGVPAVHRTRRSDPWRPVALYALAGASAATLLVAGLVAAASAGGRERWGGLSGRWLVAAGLVGSGNKKY